MTTQINHVTRLPQAFTQLTLLFPLSALPTLLFIGDLLQWLGYLWWVWLGIIALWYFGWAREHLAFSPMLALVVAAILIYFLVIEHPFIGTLGVVGWILLTSGILWLIPVLPTFLNIFRR